MKRLTLILLTVLLNVNLSMAVPAKKGTTLVTQPDGTTVTISLHGDEWLHYETTGDGYSVVRDERGYYVYAEKQGGRLCPTAYVAHDATRRDARETAYLQGVAKYLKPDMDAAAKELRDKVRAEQQKTAACRKAARMAGDAATGAVSKAKRYSDTNYRSLVILVQFTDKQFSRTDYASIMADMINQNDYTGYMSQNGRTKVACTGSVRDYFVDNSGGSFRPEFDVFGPYTVNYSQYDAKGTENAARLINAAINAADNDIDFSEYVNNDEGTVDNIYFLFAGNGANFSGNDQRLFWPHRSIIYDPQSWSWVVKDGVYLYNYASGVELYGYTAYPQTVTMDGIGTFCHEFSHVLGLPDFYDTDYEQSGGESNHPGEWSVMAGGSYYNNGRTPVGYSLFERAAVGFTDEPPALAELGHYTLDAISSSNTGFILETPDENEAFLLENRQQVKWDALLPGHGLLVFRTDMSNQSVWDNNRVNATPSHMYYELLRATGNTSGSASSGDPFPGSGRVTTLDNNTSPANLITWSKKENPFGLDNIKEVNGVVSFDLVDVLKVRSVSLPETVRVGAGLCVVLHPDVVPSYAPHTLTWASDHPEVAAVDETGKVTGLQEGTATITVTTDNGLSSATVVTVYTPVVAEHIKSFKALENNDEALLTLTGAQVCYVDGTDCYLRDETGAIILHDTGLTLKTGDVLNGSIYGRRDVSGKMPLLVKAGEQTTGDNLTVTAGEAPQPKVVKVPELTEEDYCEYVSLERTKMVMEKVNRQSYAMAKDGEKQIFVNNKFKVALGNIPADFSDYRFKITGIYGTRLMTLGDETTYDDIYPTESLEVLELLNYLLNYDVTEGGRLLLDGRELTASGSESLLEETDHQLSAVADEGYELESALLDGTDVVAVLLGDEPLKIESVDSDHVLTVAFKKTEVVDGIESIGTDTADSRQVYRADGRRVARIQDPGLYVVRSGKKVYKVVRR